MKGILFTGSGVAIVTPFHAGAVNFPAFGRLIDRQIDGGTDAIIVCGTTGEASTMSYHERMRTVEFCVEHVNGRVPVIAGSGSNATENAMTLSRDAERAGADGLLLVTPYYNKANKSGMLAHFQAVADAVSQAGYDPYAKKILGLTEMQKLLGKKKFDELLGGLIEKPGQARPCAIVR